MSAPIAAAPDRQSPAAAPDRQSPPLVGWRTIGGSQVFPIGLGAMELSVGGRPSEAEAIRTVHAALERGVNLVDTADAYCMGPSEVGHNERLVGKALRSHGSAANVLVATKGGHTRGEDGSWGLDGRPQYLRSACEASLEALGVEAIGLYQFHRPDPAVAYEDSVGALAALLDEGKIRMAGISNASIAQIDIANEVLGGRLVSVQNEFSPRFRSSEAELHHCAELGIAFLPWSPLGGMGSAAELGSRHPEFARIAAGHGVSAQRVCLAWELAKADVVVPIPGCKRRETILDSAGAADLDLTPEELAALDAGAGPDARA
ncbi:MAG: aldo/keto reductase [Acidimicrobiales bacterium]